MNLRRRSWVAGDAIPGLCRELPGPRASTFLDRDMVCSANERKLNKTKVFDLRQADSVVYERGRKLNGFSLRIRLESSVAVITLRTGSRRPRWQSGSNLVASLDCSFQSGHKRSGIRPLRIHAGFWGRRLRVSNPENGHSVRRNCPRHRRELSRGGLRPPGGNLFCAPRQCFFALRRQGLCAPHQ